MLGAAEAAGAGVELLLLMVAVPNRHGVVVDEVVVLAGLLTMKLKAGFRAAAVESV